ncbi:hypothetical protein [Salinirubrum litoreum]|uniref:Uncharacterized protein n=1 Tax=Salinirubrum litoreum TaxID=1126234 RepID=A0ABD5R7Q9_9EURY|nr:hypothetical protein [Salinirubrum litoreum]
MDTAVAATLLQLIALAIPPVAVLLQMLRNSEHLGDPWRVFCFGLALSSVCFYLASGLAVLRFLSTALGAPLLLRGASGLLLLGLAPFAVFVVVLFREDIAD